MNQEQEKTSNTSDSQRVGLIDRLARRGVLRVALSYGVIAWLLLQIGDVTLDPLGAPEWVMSSLIIVVVIGFPLAILLAWFFELTPQGVELDRAAPSAARPAVHGVRRYTDVIIISVLVLTVAFLLTREFGLISNRSDQSPVVAVLPFHEIGTNEVSELGLGLADTLIHRLGKLKQLIVLAPSSTFEFVNAQIDLQDVAEKLGANSILQGSLQRSGTSLRINARLTDVTKGVLLWSGSYDRPVGEFFALQDEIATMVTEALRIALTPDQKNLLAHAETTQLSAQEARVLASQKISSRQLGELQEAVELLRQAVKIDPDYALAYASLAEALFLTVVHSRGDIIWESIALEAQSSAARAQAINPQLGEAYYAQALVALLENDMVSEPPWPEEHIIALFRRANQLSPNNAQILFRLAFYSKTLEEELELTKEAALLDPRSGLTRLSVGEMYADLGDYEQALDWYLKAAVAVEPYFSFGYAYIPRMFMNHVGRPDEAARWALAFRNAHPEDFRGHWELTYALFELAAWEQWEEAMQTLLEIPDDPGRFRGKIEMIMQIKFHQAQGRLDEAANLGREFQKKYFEISEQWPDLSNFEGSMGLVSLFALEDMVAGRPQIALDRFSYHYPNQEITAQSHSWSELFQPNVIVALLHRQLGDVAKADELLNSYLATIENAPWTGGGNDTGFLRFTVYAFLGRTDEAIESLQTAVDHNRFKEWMFLKSGDFDANYAAVIADPRFQTIYTEIENRMAILRESFIANPEIPPQYKVK